jgi:Flp pilus assembly protein CpaB
MKKSHIVVLIGIAIAIGALIMMSVDFSTYDTIVSAKKKQVPQSIQVVSTKRGP